MSNNLRLFIALSALILFCTSCGKHPDVLDPPDGGDPKAFPRTYPDTSTDPAGVSIPQH